MTFTDGKKLQLKNVMVGEVWFCSGQSNMEMPVAGWGKVMNYEQEIAEANYPSIRLFQVKKNTSVTPLSDVEATMGGWQECSSATIPEFSSLAYFYARSLWKELNVPVGVIDCTWGGTPAEAWTSYETLKQVLGFHEELAKMEQLDFDPVRMEKAYNQERSEWQSLFSKEDKGMEEDKPCWIAPDLSEEQWQDMCLPGYWERNGLKNFDGVVWFRRSLEIPAEWIGKPLKLNLGMIDDEDITYFNGVEIARGAGYMTPRTYTIPAKLVKAGKAVLAVRVSDFGGEGGIHGKAEELYVEADGKRISLAGDWKYRIGLSLKGFPPAPVSPIQSSSYPTVLFNAMVKPWTAFPIKGVIWYQGEANVGRSEQYEDLFPALITDWRRQWRSDFPFYFVQLANFMESKEIQPDSEWAALREAQTKALKLDQVGMAVTIDIGLADDIHPKNKQEVGRRLALVALVGSYGKNVSGSAPVFRNYRIKGDKMELIIQKAVELGAYAVVPVETRRCVVKLDAKKAQKKVTRWQQISESAAKQSKRMLIPEVKNVMSWKEALAFAKGLDVVLIPYELAQGMKETREILAAIQPGQSVGIFIGPEGGFEEEEVRDAMEAGGKPVTLGKRILRTETAGMTMLSILMYTLESV